MANIENEDARDAKPLLAEPKPALEEAQRENAKQMGDGVPRSYAADDNPNESSAGSTGTGGGGG